MSTLKATGAAVTLIARGDSDDPIAGRFPAGCEGDFRATAIALEADQRVCFVSVDALTLPDGMGERVAAAVTDQTGLPDTNLLLSATHTHHGPCTIDFLGCRSDATYTRRLEEGMVQAAVEAVRGLENSDAGPNELEAELLLGLGQEATVGRNSRLLLQDDTIGWYGYQEADTVRPTGPYDPDLHLLALRRPGGKLAGLLFNHSVHNIGRLNDGACSPGFYGLTARGLQEEHEATTLFLPGAFGSTHNITYEGSGVPPAECLQRMTEAIGRALRRAEPALCGRLTALRRPFTYHLRDFDEEREAAAVEYYARRYLGPSADNHIRIFREMREEMAPLRGQARQTSLQAIRLGEVALVGIPGEFFARLGLELRRRSPFRHTCIIGLANEEIGYIPDREAYDLGGYQLWVGWHSRTAPGTGEAMVDQAVAMLEELYDERPRVAIPGLRPLANDDAPALQRFYNTLGAEARRLFRPLGWNASLSACEEVCRDAKAGKRYDVVVDDGRGIVGWCFLVRFASPTPHLGIGLAERWCGRGLGRALMQAVLEEARHQGKEAIDLIVVQENERARRLYEKCGFRTTGAHTGGDGQDYYEMRLEL